MSKKKLRVGLLLDSFDVAAWSYQMIENIIGSDYADIVLIVINDTSADLASNDTFYSKIMNNRGRIGYVMVRKALQSIYGHLIERNTHLPDASERRNCRELLPDCPVIRARTVKTKWSDYFDNDSIQSIHSHDVDILVRSGFGILRGEILNAARYGVWSYHHGDNLTNRGGPAGFWESMESWPETGSVLHILNEDLDNGTVLYRSYSCTDKMSVKNNANGVLWKSSFFMTRKMKELYETGADAFFDKVQHENRHPVFYSGRLYTTPSNRELARLTINKVIEKTKLLLRKRVYLDQWILLFHLKEEFSSSLWRYKKIVPPKDRFWADPHIVHSDSKYFIFLEEYMYDTKKGHIAVIIMNEDGEYSAPEKVLDRPYHLSYPFVFEHEGQCYMIPESVSNNTIELYKCIEFPYKWEFQMNLMENVRAVDATLLFHKDRWWMFANCVESDGVSTWDELFLFHSRDLFSTDWKAHPRNPVISDCKSARPAGKVFSEGGRLYRPSQNCSNKYGYGFNINEIVALDESRYEEVIVSSVKPSWDKSIVGTHTFNRVDALHVIDGIYRRRK